MHYMYLDIIKYCQLWILTAKGFQYKYTTKTHNLACISTLLVLQGALLGSPSVLEPLTTPLVPLTGAVVKPPSILGEANNVSVNSPSALEPLTAWLEPLTSVVIRGTRISIRHTRSLVCVNKPPVIIISRAFELTFGMVLIMEIVVSNTKYLIMGFKKSI